MGEEMCGLGIVCCNSEGMYPVSILNGCDGCSYQIYDTILGQI
jgi:hypothetical protein